MRDTHYGDTAATADVSRASKKRTVRTAPPGPLQASGERAALPALIVSATERRFARAAAIARRLGFEAQRTPAVFVNGTSDCQGTNGHRLAMRGAWQRIVATQTAMAVFEDDIVPAEPHAKAAASAGTAADDVDELLARQLREHIERWAPHNDVLWLGGIGQLGECAKPGSDCSPASVPYDHHRTHPRDALPFTTGAWAQNAWGVRQQHRLPVRSTFYTDHAHYVTPRGAALLLACTRHCLARAGAGVDPRHAP